MIRIKIWLQDFFSGISNNFKMGLFRRFVLLGTLLVRHKLTIYYCHMRYAVAGGTVNSGVTVISDGGVAPPNTCVLHRHCVQSVL